MIKRKTDRIILLLRERAAPFNRMSGPALVAAREAMRVYPLRAGDRLTLRGRDGSETLFLASGEVTVGGGTFDLDHPLALPHDGELTITALGNAEVCLIDAATLDGCQALDALEEERTSGGDDPRTLLVRLRNAEAFRSLPFEMVAEAIRRMTAIDVEAGAEPVRQGYKGDAFYVIQSGNAEVWREDDEDDEPRLRARLTEGDCFGEDALLSGHARNATVRMTTPGRLLRLEKEDFDELITNSLVVRISPDAARRLLAEGQGLLDVRYADEIELHPAHGAVVIPLPQLRQRMGELDVNTPWLVMCARGHRAAAAALLLARQGYTASVIDGGMAEWRG